MSSWLSSSLGGLAEQVSSFTKEVITENDGDDPMAELVFLREAEAQHQHRLREMQELQEQRDEAVQRADAAEVQIATISQEYRKLLTEKESDIIALKSHVHDLSLEQRDHELGRETPEDHMAVLTGKYTNGADSHLDDISDLLTAQREIVSLKTELRRTKNELTNNHSVSVPFDLPLGHIDGDQAQLQSIVQQLRDEQHKLTSKYEEELQQLKDEHMDKVTELAGEVTRMERLRAEAESRAEDMERELEALEAETSASLAAPAAVSQQEYERGDLAAAEWRQKYDEQQRTVEQLSSVVKQTMDAKQQALGAVAELEQQNMALRNELTRLQGAQELLQARQQLMALQDQLDVTQAENQTMRQKMHTTDLRLQEMEHTLAQQAALTSTRDNESVETLVNQRDQLQQTVVVLESHLQRASAELSDTQRQLQQKSQEYRQHVEDLNGAKAELQAKYECATADFKVQASASASAYKAAEAQVASLTAELKATQSELAQALEENQVLAARVHEQMLRFEGETAAAVKEAAQARAELAEALAENDELCETVRLQTEALHQARHTQPTAAPRLGSLEEAPRPGGSSAIAEDGVGVANLGPTGAEQTAVELQNSIFDDLSVRLEPAGDSSEEQVKKLQQALTQLQEQHQLAEAEVARLADERQHHVDMLSRAATSSDQIQQQLQQAMAKLQSVDQHASQQHDKLSQRHSFAVSLQPSSHGLTSEDPMVQACSMVADLAADMAREVGAPVTVWPQVQDAAEGFRLLPELVQAVSAGSLQQRSRITELEEQLRQRGQELDLLAQENDVMQQHVAASRQQQVPSPQQLEVQALRAACTHAEEQTGALQGEVDASRVVVAALEERLQAADARSVMQQQQYHDLQLELPRLRAAAATAQGDLQQQLRDLQGKACERDALAAKQQGCANNVAGELANLAAECESLRSHLQRALATTAAAEAQLKDAEQQLAVAHHQKCQLDKACEQYEQKCQALQQALDVKSAELVRLVAEDEDKAKMLQSELVELRSLDANHRSTIVGLKETIAELSSNRKQTAESALAMENGRLTVQLKSLQEHLLQLETATTEDGIRRDEQMSYLQQQLRESREQAACSLAAADNVRRGLEAKCSEATARATSIAVERDRLAAGTARLKEEKERAQLSVANLELVLNQFEADKESHVVSARQTLQAELDAAQASAEDLRQQMERAQDRIQQLQGELSQHSLQQGDTHVLQGLNTSLQAEVRRLQEQLSEAHARVTKMLTSADERMIDKELMRNMLVSYFTSDRKVDVMKVIATLLDMDDHDRYQVGLHQQRGFLASLLSGPPPPPVEPRERHRQTFTEQFVRFLMKESHTDPPVPAEAAGPPALPPPEPVSFPSHTPHLAIARPPLPASSVSTASEVLAPLTPRPLPSLDSVLNPSNGQFSSDKDQPATTP